MTLGRKARTLKHTLGMALARTAALTAVGAIALTVQGLAETDAAVTPSHGTAIDQVIAARPLAEGSPLWLLEKHESECWRSGQPAKAATPGHVIARTAEESVVRYRSDLVGPALEQLFDGVDHGLEITAFCV